MFLIAVVVVVAAPHAVVANHSIDAIGVLDTVFIGDEVPDQSARHRRPTRCRLHRRRPGADAVDFSGGATTNHPTGTDRPTGADHPTGADARSVGSAVGDHRPRCPRWSLRAIATTSTIAILSSLINQSSEAISSPTEGSRSFWPEEMPARAGRGFEPM